MPELNLAGLDVLVVEDDPMLRMRELNSMAQQVAELVSHCANK